jgi:hypothetical protein
LKRNSKFVRNKFRTRLVMTMSATPRVLTFRVVLV